MNVGKCTWTDDLMLMLCTCPVRVRVRVRKKILDTSIALIIQKGELFPNKEILLKALLVEPSVAANGADDVDYLFVHVDLAEANLTEVTPLRFEALDNFQRIWTGEI